VLDILSLSHLNRESESNMILSRILYLLFFCFAISSPSKTSVSASTLKSLRGTFTMTYKGEIKKSTPVGPATTNFRGMWSKDEVGNVLLRTRETDVEKWHWNADEEDKVDKDEFELFVPNEKGSFLVYSGSKMLNTCNVKTASALPEIDLSKYKLMDAGKKMDMGSWHYGSILKGSDETIEHNTERWFYRVPSRCRGRHMEHYTWWFTQLGEPKIEVPVKYNSYYSEACISHQGWSKIESWAVDSFTNDVDGRLFAVPEACLKLDE